MSILESCPFCQSEEPYIEVQREKTIGAVKYFVACNNCCAQGPRASTKGDAILEWEHR